MKIPPRIIAPVLLAALCAGLLLAFLWWQLTDSTLRMSSREWTHTVTGTSPLELPDTTSFDTADVSLMHLREGDLFALRGEWADAQESYSLAVKEDGGLPALRKLAQAQLQRRDIRGLKSTISQMKTAGARPEDILLLEVIVKLRSGELVEAAAALHDAEDSPQQHYGLALLSLIQGNHESAQHELAQTVNGWDPVLRNYARTLQAAYDEFALFPNGSDIHLITLLARALAQVQECELALPLLVQVTTAQEDYRDAWIVQGYCELTTERTKQALASLEHAYSLDPQKPEIQYFLARSYDALKEYQNAITFYEYALSNGFAPEAEVRRLIARAALEIGNAGLALKQYEALTDDPSATLESFRGFVAAAASLGRPEDAFAKAIAATERWPDDAQAFLLLGSVAEELGKQDEANAAYQRALQINPNLPNIQGKIQGS